jgi:Zn-dependent M28 family amino/carboxypeptidase
MNVDPVLGASGERLLGRAWTDPFPERFLAALTDVEDRTVGGHGERRAASLVQEALAEVGVPVVESTFDVRRWTHSRTTLRAGTGGDTRPFEAVALPYSPPAEFRAPLVDAGHGTPEEIDDAGVSGAVVIAEQGGGGDRHVHRMEKFGHAATGGAAAFVLVNDTPGGLPVTGTLRFGDIAAIPGVGVSKETGERLRRYARGGGEVSLRVEAGTEPAEGRNVLGWLGAEAPAPGAVEDCVVVLAHYDAHDLGEGALDNGCGVAVALGAARLLAENGFEPSVPVCVACVTGEETGLLGSEALADRFDPDAVRAVINVDGAGRARNLKTYTHGAADLEALVEAVLGEADQPFGLERRPHPYSDHWPFLRAGVPSLQLHAEPADPTAPWGPRGRPVVHTRADTLDKVEFRDVREHAGLTALLVRALVGTRPERVEPTDLAGKLREAGAEAGMRAADVWPTDW